MTELTEQLKQFSNTLSGGIIESTGASVKYCTSPLYNVDGSNDDPKRVPGHAWNNWKKLLVSLGGISKDAKCYVTTQGVADKHPKFQVGGHVTTNSDGDVEEGGTCFLMPMCRSHNSKGWDGTRFTHTETKMLQLTGYMEGEPTLLFVARLQSPEPFSLLQLVDGGWVHANVDSAQAEKAKRDRPDAFLLLRRTHADGRPVYEIDDAHLPTGA